MISDTRISHHDVQNFLQKNTSLRFEDQEIANYRSVGTHGFYTDVTVQGEEKSALNLCKLPHKDYVGVSQ